MTSQLRLVVAVSGAGHVVHNLEEFGPTAAFAAQSLLPIAVTAGFYLAARRPTRRYLQALLAWVVIVVVLGGGSVLPLAFLPFEPAQTASHYLAHLAYALLQVPALVVAWRALSADDARREPIAG